MESTRRLLRAFSFAPPFQPSGAPAMTGSADNDWDHPPTTTSDGHHQQVTYSVELEPWPTKPRRSEDSDLSSSSSSSSSSAVASSSSSSAAAAAAPASGSFADRLAALPSYQPRQRFPTPSIRSAISRADSLSSNASSIISTRGGDAVASCSRRAQRRASEDAWRQFWD